jgi:hypothetical protein
MPSAREEHGLRDVRDALFRCAFAQLAGAGQVLQLAEQICDGLK